MVLGQVDLEKLVEKHLNSVQDWERNFKALKARGKESERLPRCISHITKHGNIIGLYVLKYP